jgi:acyl-CoA synthetase (AMP-forming)/AMP-acid ligase II
LDEFLSSRLAPGKIPSVYFEVSRLPMTGSGKLQRALISETADYVKRRIY